MQIEVMEYFGIKKYFRDADFFETDTAKRLFRQLKKIIPEGQIAARRGPRVTTPPRSVSGLITDNRHRQDP